jgi:hypothetical protein
MPILNRLFEIIDEVRKEEGIDPDSHHLLMNMDENEIAKQLRSVNRKESGSRSRAAKQFLAPL